MSKAFMREDDDAPERTALRRTAPALPPGARNYLTPGGERRLRAELEQLVHTERSRLAALPEDSTAQRGLRVVDQRISHLEQSLRTAVVVPPPAATEDRVRFGAIVTVRERNGVETRYRIVGVDEVDVDRDWVSWLSPVAKALLNARLGQRVRFKVPSGEQELEILAIAYE
jgi:transcription elongation factor GreB